MEAAIFYVCFVLFVVCALAACWILYAGGKVCEESDKLLDSVEYYVFRVLVLIAAASMFGIGYSWQGGL